MLEYEINALRMADRAPIRSAREIGQLVLAWWLLAAVYIALKVLSFARVQSLVAAMPTVDFRNRRATSVAMMECCAAVNRARQYFFFAHVRCLMRSVATVCFLRLHGHPATMVVGVRRMPFHAHAWAELEGVVVNDFPSVQTRYAVIKRC